MKRILLSILLLLPLQIYACDPPGSKEDVDIVKKMFSQFAEKRDMTQFDKYYSSTFILESNGSSFNYQQYKALEATIYKTLKSLTVTKYSDIFAADDHKVVSRMNIKLVKQSGETHEFEVMLIAQIKNNKIDRIWEVTYPAWK